MEDPVGERERCWNAATKAYDRACALVKIRPGLQKPQRSEAANLIDELKEMSSLLKDCADLVLVYQNRLGLVRDFLEIVLPSISNTNKKLIDRLADEDFFFDKTAGYKWDKLLLAMFNEVGASLHTRFIAYKGFIQQVVYLLQSPSKLEQVSFHAKIEKVLKLRIKQGIPYMDKCPPIPHPSSVKISTSTSHWWAQNIFGRKKEKTMINLEQSSIPLNPSRCIDRPYSAVADEIPRSAVVLYRLTFNNNLLSVVVYTDKKDRARMWVRWRDDKDEGGPACYASRGLHELRIDRKGSSIILEDYNDRKGRPEKWLVLNFKYWEEMVLFHDCFAALKQENPDTVECDPEELTLGKERIKFRAYVEPT